MYVRAYFLRVSRYRSAPAPSLAVEVPAPFACAAHRPMPPAFVDLPLR